MAQILTCLIALGVGDDDQRVESTIIFCFAIAFAVSNMISFRVACVYYDSVLKGCITKRESVWIGMIPGLSMLILYSVFFDILSRGIVRGSGYLALLVPVAAIVQWYFLKKLLRGSAASTDLVATVSPTVSAYGVFSVLALMLISHFLTRYRDYFSQLAPAYGALIIMALNTLSSVANTVTRVSFLTRGKQVHKMLLCLGLCSCVFALVVIRFEYSLLASLLVLLGLQFLMIAVIEYARGLVVSDSRSSEI
jgi:hypothetical protein